MAITANKRNTVSKEMLKAWYADSLSLLPQQSASTGDELRADSSALRSCLGIMMISTLGNELEESGDSQTCRDYISSRGTKKIVQSGMLVEKFNGGLIIVSPTAQAIRIIFIHYGSLANILDELVPGTDLPNSELHLLTQILCGISLKQASIIDGVSYETKRTQFKSLAARTGFRSQGEVIRNTLLALISYALDSIGNVPVAASASQDEAKIFLNRYYPGIFRFHQISTSNGRRLRVAETGPLDGIPVIWLHSQTLPSPDQFDSDWLLRSKIRLIIPLREGFLGDEKKQFSRRRHLEQCSYDIAATIDLFCNGRARIVANSSGVPYAINLAVNSPQHIDRLTFCSAGYVGRYENKPVHRFVHGVKNLFTKNEMLIAKMFERYLSKMSTAAGTLEVLKSSYKKSFRDMEIFTKLLSNSIGHSWMYESYRMSRHSVVMDFTMGGYDVWQHARKISCPVLFVHGRSDPINSITDARHTAKLVKHSKFIEFEKDGQSLFIDRLADLVIM